MTLEAIKKAIGAVIKALIIQKLPKFKQNSCIFSALFNDPWGNWKAIGAVTNAFITQNFKILSEFFVKVTQFSVWLNERWANQKQLALLLTR